MLWDVSEKHVASSVLAPRALWQGGYHVMTTLKQDYGETMLRGVRCPASTRKSVGAPPKGRVHAIMETDPPAVRWLQPCLTP
jgi:hypothetical protein